MGQLLQLASTRLDQHLGVLDGRDGVLSGEVHAVLAVVLSEAGLAGKWQLLRPPQKLISFG